MKELDWRSDESDAYSLTLEVLGFTAFVRPSIGRKYWTWWTSFDDGGYCDTLEQAKEAAVYNLRLSLEEQESSAKDGLEELNKLGDQSGADKACYTRGLRRKQGA